MSFKEKLPSPYQLHTKSVPTPNQLPMVGSEESPEMRQRRNRAGFPESAAAQIHTKPLSTEKYKEDIPLL